MNETVIRLDIPASQQFISVTHACLQEMLQRMDNLTMNDPFAYELRLALHEACSNIVDHAYHGQEGRIELAFHLIPQPLAIAIDIIDHGQSFDIDHIPQPNLEQPQVRGYGIYLMRQLLDEVVYETHPEYNHWRLVKHVR